MKAVIDASTLYGASRHLRRVHDQEDYEYRHSFTAAQDRLLFLEFIHVLLLYDDVLIDNSSIDIDRQSDTDSFWSADSPLRKELRPLVERVAAQGGPAISERNLCFLEERDHDLIKDLICDQLATSIDRRLAEQIPVPWAYNETHADYGSFKFRCERAKISSLIPLALFLYRALVYAAFSQSAHAVYLAAPGRLRALDVFLHDSDKRHFDFPRRGYADLLSILNLPEGGYDFSYLSNSSRGAYELSTVTRHLQGLSGEEAIDGAMKVRMSDDGRALRAAWNERLGNMSTLVGMEQIEVTQSVNNASVAGDIIQTINIVPNYIWARPRWKG